MYKIIKCYESHHLYRLLKIHWFYKLIFYSECCLLPSSSKTSSNSVAFEQTVMTVVPVLSQRKQNTSDPPTSIGF